MERINRLVIDSTHSVSDLCVLATEFPTDKSPYHYVEGQREIHRHPYTAIYDMLFAARRYDPLVLGELGILENMSMHAWRSYFPYATLFGFEVFPDKIAAAEGHALPNTHYARADVTDAASLFQAFNTTGQMFDILIDDSTHMFDDQIRFIEAAVAFMKPGGTLIIEDIFRGWEDARYCDALQPLFRYFSSGIFIEANHAHGYSGGEVWPYYDNDKLLVLVRNQLPIERHHPARERNLRLLSAALAEPSFRARAHRGKDELHSRYSPPA